MSVPEQRPHHHQTWSRIQAGLYGLFGMLAVLSAFVLSQRTLFNVNPDEHMHADAFCYFESHWWPPDLNNDGLLYSPDGWSRVYNGELVYLIYGRITPPLRPIAHALAPVPAKPIALPQPDQARSTYLPLLLTPMRCEHAAPIYRLLNVLLFAGTLLLAFLVGRTQPIATMLGIVMACTPQVIYIYSYANSDAWGLSSLVALFLAALTSTAQSILYRRSIVGLAILTALVLLSKEPFWLGLPFIAVVLWRPFADRLRTDRDWRQVAARGLAGLALVLILIAPLKIIYPLTQPDFTARAETMRDIRAWDEYKPDNLTREGYRMAAKGAPFQTLLTDPVWWSTSLKSLYGVFAHLIVYLPEWAYILAALIYLGLLIGSYVPAIKSRRRLEQHERILRIAAPIAIALLFLASLYNSWTYDYQPQGRYLLAALLPLAIMMTPPRSTEAGRTAIVRQLLILALFGLCMYAIWGVALHAPGLVPVPPP